MSDHGASGVDTAGRTAADDPYDPDRDGPFSAWLRERSDWEAATRHRFVEEYVDGDLADDVFERYLVQDYQFLEAGARLTAHAASQAHTMAEMNRLAESLTVLTGGENDYFQRAFDELDVSEAEREAPEIHPTTAAFNDFMLRAATDGAYEESLAVTAAAEWVYRDWCGYVATAETDLDRWYIDEWIEIHDNEEFDAYTGWLIDQLDTYGPRLSPGRQIRVAEIFDRTVDLEAAFFDAAYED
ncbi:TenA family protein [Halovivax cerinus]|uniref:TenA family protein n=1 Tax=Halovivax cerinus TaxID=1487865 RepID=A0ABD5NSG4_9EURY|nr:TenA family protein [Halovivax cerinus]